MLYKILILACSVYHPGPYGCGPSSHLPENQVPTIVVGEAVSEAECFMKGNKELRNHPDTAEVFRKVICVAGVK